VVDDASVIETLGLARIRWLLLAMGVATAPFLTELPPWMPLGILALGWWRWWGERRGRLALRRPLRLLIAALVFGLLLVTGHLQFGIQASLLFISFLWAKLLELRTERDYMLACFLCYFLVAVQLFDSSSLLTCAYALGSLGVITVAAVRFHAGREARSLLPLVGVMVLQALPLALVLFLFCPRVQMRLPNLGGQTVAGFTDAMRPGDIAKVAAGDQVAFRVEFPDGHLPDESALYWRGLVMNETDGATWRHGDPYRGTGPHQGTGGESDRGPAVTQQIVLMPHGQPWVFALDTPVAAPEEANLLPDRTLLAKGGTVSRIMRYTVVSQPGARAHDAGLELKHCLACPRALSARTVALGQQFARAGQGVKDRIDAGLAWIQGNGFTYTLEPGEMGSDPVDTFLFEKRSGFCAHYATAFCLLMRLAGVPARVIVGYRGGEANAFGAFLVVHQQHAHAWCEVWDAGARAWLRVDPTYGLNVAPGQSVPASLGGAAAAATTSVALGLDWAPEWARGPLHSVRMWWQYVDARWDALAMGYGAEQQEAVLARFGLARFGMAATVVVLVATLLVLLLALFALMRIRQRRRSDPVLQAYADFCSRLRRGGVPREPWEGPLAHAERAAAELSSHASIIHEAAALYVQLRYGSHPQPAAGVAHLNVLVRRLSGIGGITQRFVRKKKGRTTEGARR
jgi:transglutaminase-like putative cysteine protease